MTGIPHWIRPSLLASEAYNSIGAHIIASTKVEEEPYFVTKILQARGPQGPGGSWALESINWLSAGLLMTDPGAKSCQVFVCQIAIDRALLSDEPKAINGILVLITGGTAL